jgi:streptomycin 6-kinase
MFPQDISMLSPALRSYLADWRLMPEGCVVETPTSWLLPVRHDDGPAMLKLPKPESDERNGAAVLLHGDLHHDHVLASARGWLAIDPKGVIGERSYEVANLLGNPCPHGELVHDRDRMLRLASVYAENLGLDAARILAFALAHAGLSATWSIEDGEDPGFRLACADILDPLVE